MMTPNEALHPLERKGWVRANREIPKSGKRECKLSVEKSRLYS